MGRWKIRSIGPPLTNGVYPPRCRAGRNQEQLLWRINRVGLNHATKLADGTGIRGMLFKPYPVAANYGSALTNSGRYLRMASAACL